MKNPRAVAQRIAELHNEGMKLSAKRVEDTKRSVEDASTVGEKVIWLVENAVEDASARTTEETVELGHKLLDFAHMNANAYFDWLHEIVRVKSLSDFIAVCIKCKNWYSISQTASDSGAHHGTTDDRSVRAFAVKPRAFGAPLCGVGA